MRGKWSGEWQISKNFGACGASGKFFSKFRETLRHPKPPLYCKTPGSREPGTQYRYSTVVCVPAPPSVFELYPLCPVCVPAPPSDFLPVPVPVRNVFVPCPVCVPAPPCVFLPVPAPPGVFLPVRGRPLLSRPRGAVGPGPAAVESAAASVVALTCGVCVVGGFRWL